MKYFKKLIGDTCYLSPISMDDLEKYTEWVNDLEVGQFVLFSTGIYDIEKERRTLEHLMKDSHIFAIVEKETNKTIGNCGIHKINEIHRWGLFGIFIGDKSFWNKGIGAEATKLCLDYAFNILNLNSISLEVVDYNHRAVKCYEKVGFKQVGKLREHIFIAGAYHDIYIYDILSSEFESPYVRQVFEHSITEEAGRNKITII